MTAPGAPGSPQNPSPPGKPRIPAPKVYGAKPRATAAEPSGASPVLAGIIAGLGAAALWALVAYVTHYAFSWGALGLGALVGLAVRKAAGQGNPSLGITAAAIAVGALIFGKLLIHLFALQPIIEDEMLGNQQAVNVAYFLDMAHRRAFSPELQAALPEVVWSDSTLLSDSVPRPLRERMLQEALDSARRAPLAERKVVVHRAVSSVAKIIGQQVGFSKVFRAEFGLWDALWIVLAISAAWRIASKSSSTQHMATVEDEQAMRLAEERRMRQEQVRRAQEEADRRKRQPPST